ncbi:hypothetical protein ACHAWO_004360 [Cyclotella atomus]|uniref:Amine oxidase domain-containing protein n=1 Tax=Cyclotella atomus TaxID=382360 RepID=A0ABD3N8N9_9STRA
MTIAMHNLLLLLCCSHLTISVIAFQPSLPSRHITSRERPKIVIIGGGWAGYTVAESLSTNNLHSDQVEILLLDASKSGGGLAGGYREGKRPVEAGIHGFWREYKNTFAVMDGIEGVNINEVLSDYTPSVLYSKNGKVAVAPVLLNEDKVDTLFTVPLKEERIRRLIAEKLPPPLDLPILAKLDTQSSNLQPLDVLSGLGLLGAWADFEQESPASWKAYDEQPASLLFEKAGITDNLYQELVSPLLHVLPMCPAYDCSAAAALSCFHVFALQSKGAFDVRWCRGSIGELIFHPWKHQLEGRGVQFKNGARVACISSNDDEEVSLSGETPSKYSYAIQLDDNSRILCDAVVIAIGAVAAGKLAGTSPALSSLPATENFDKLRGVTCIAVRLFLKPDTIISDNLQGGFYSKTQLPPDVAKSMTDSPIAVCGAGIGGISELKETGFCIYDLQRMHDEFSVEYYNANSVELEDQVAVLEVDFYRADSFVDMSDAQIVGLTLKAVSEALGTKIINTEDVVESKVLRARNAVSHFAPKSALYSPGAKVANSIYMAGDWIDRTGHASWSTEKSVVTARQAAYSLSVDFGLDRSSCTVIPAAADTPQLSALRKSAKMLRSIAPPKTLPPSPWVLAKQLLSGEK